MEVFEQPIDVKGFISQQGVKLLALTEYLEGVQE